ncbi:hypothetical protein AXM70_19505 [Salmonella enterica subsp. enterica]|nr:hypothetical protein [Salmonella enterica subsp. enterica]MIQ60406.1 hypothetical protein [Salmonella enterica subsp. enterica]
MRFRVHRRFPADGKPFLQFAVRVMAGSDTIVVIRYMTMKVMLAPKYKAPGNIYQALCRLKTIKHRFLVPQDLPGKMATHS